MTDAQKESKAVSDKKYREANPKKLADYQKKWRDANPEKIKARVKKYHEAHPEKMPAYQKLYREANREKSIIYQREYNHGVSDPQFKEMMSRQGEKCAICRLPFPKTPHIDHCHGTGKVRGLLCNLCNVALGALGDSPERCYAAGQYLQKSAPLRHDDGTHTDYPCSSRGTSPNSTVISVDIESTDPHSL